MSGPITIYDNFTATIPAGEETDIVTVTIPKDIYYTWATGTTPVSFAFWVSISPWYIASGTVDGPGLILTTAGLARTQISLSNSRISTNYTNGGPSENPYPDSFVLETEEIPIGLSLKIVNTGLVDVTISHFTLSAIARVNRSALPDYTSAWSGEPNEVTSASSVTDYLDITYTLPSGGASADLLLPKALSGGLGSEDDVPVTAVSIPSPMPLFYDTLWSGIPITIDRGLGPGPEYEGQVYIVFWDIDGNFIDKRPLSTTFTGTTGFAELLPIGNVPNPETPAYWAAFAYLELPIIDFHGTDLGVHTGPCSVSVDFWVAYPLTGALSAYGAIAFASVFALNILATAGTRSFAQVVG